MSKKTTYNFPFNPFGKIKLDWENQAWFHVFMDDGLKIISLDEITFLIRKHLVNFVDRYYNEQKISEDEASFPDPYIERFFINEKGQFETYVHILKNLVGVKYKFENYFTNYTSFPLDIERFYNSETFNKIDTMNFNTNYFLDSSNPNNVKINTNRDQLYFYFLRRIVLNNKKVGLIDTNTLSQKILATFDVNRVNNFRFEDLRNNDFLIVDVANISTLKSWFVDKYLLKLFEWAITTDLRLIIFGSQNVDSLTSAIIKKTENNKVQAQFVLEKFFNNIRIF